MSTSAEPIAVEPPAHRRAHAEMGRYGVWQLRDYATQRGLPTIIVSTLFGYISVGPMLMMLKLQVERLPPATIARYGSVEAARVAMLHDVNIGFLQQFLGAVVFLGALFAMNGIVAEDRKKGYYRFLFSKPLSPSRYYGQAFLIHWAGFVAVACVLALLYGALVAPIISVPLVYVLALMFLMYAGIAFTLSAVARWDWLSLVAVTVLAMYMWGRFGESTAVAAKLLYLLPPIHRTREIYDAVAKGAPLNAGLLAWFAGYGIVCYVIGLVVLHHRRLAIV